VINAVSDNVILECFTTITDQRLKSKLNSRLFVHYVFGFTGGLIDLRNSWRFKKSQNDENVNPCNVKLVINALVVSYG
jgi:hypothetical protein